MSAAGLAGLGGASGGTLGSLGGSSGNGLLGSLTPIAAQVKHYKGTPATGTGIKQIISWGKASNLLTPVTLQALVPELQGCFGGYPENTVDERAPSALFIALFGVLFLGFITTWIINLTRKQNFHLSMGIAFFCILKIIGFACRLAWSYNITKLNVGICSLVFIQVAQLVLLSQNMVLAHRIFSWRHPEIGHHWAIIHFLNVVYLVVLAVIALAIVGQAIPYLYFLDQHHYNMCKNTMQAGGLLNLIYASMPLQLLAIGFIMPTGTIVKTPKIFNKQTQQEEHVLPNVYQANWIKSANIIYYPERNSQAPLFKGEPGADAVRIIPSREPPGHGHQQLGEKMHPLAPHFHWAVATVTVTSLALLMNTCFRVAATWYTGPYGTPAAKGWHVNHWVHHPYVMYIFYGGIEVLVLLTYLVMRIDLRFYIPDRPRKRGPNDQQTWNEFAGADVEKSYASQYSNNNSNEDIDAPGNAHHNWSNIPPSGGVVGGANPVQVGNTQFTDAPERAV